MDCQCCWPRWISPKHNCNLSKAYRAEFEKMVVDLKIDRTPAWRSTIEDWKKAEGRGREKLQCDHRNAVRSYQKEARMPKRKLEKVKQVKEQARLKIGRPPRAQVIPNKKKDRKIEDE